MLRIRNQMEVMDKQLAKDFKTLAERMKNLEFNVLNNVFDKNHQKAINLQQQMKSEGHFQTPASPYTGSSSALPMLNERRS